MARSVYLHTEIIDINYAYLFMQRARKGTSSRKEPMIASFPILFIPSNIAHHLAWAGFSFRNSEDTAP